MLEQKIEKKEIQDKITKKKIVLKTKVKTQESIPKSLGQTIWYASILF